MISIPESSREEIFEYRRREFVQKNSMGDDKSGGSGRGFSNCGRDKENGNMRVNLVGNINGYTYHAPEINLFDIAKQQEEKPLQQISDVLEKDSMSVEVELSQEGLEKSLKAFHGTKLAGSIDLEEQHRNLTWISEHQPIESFTNRLIQDFPKNYEQSANGEYVYVQHSYEEKKEALLTSYQKLYREIVDGYDAGNRVRFIADEASEDGCRRISKEEEIAILNQEFLDVAEWKLTDSLKEKS